MKDGGVGKAGGGSGRLLLLGGEGIDNRLEGE